MVNEALEEAIRNRVVWHCEVSVRYTVLSAMLGLLKSLICAVISLCVLVGACANILVSTPVLTTSIAVVVVAAM